MARRRAVVRKKAVRRGTAARHVMTPKRRAQLKRAQMISARKRRGTGKSKTSMRRYRAQKVVRRRKIGRAFKYGAIGGATVGTAIGAAYLHKHRERLIIAPMAEHQAVFAARMGGKTNRMSLARVRRQERIDHARRSTYRAREYRNARKLYQIASRRGYTIRPGHHRSIYKHQKSMMDIPMSSQTYLHESYIKDRNVRAQHRLRRIQGKKVRGFGYHSGKVKAVVGKRVIGMPF